MKTCLTCNVSRPSGGDLRIGDQSYCLNCIKESLEPFKLVPESILIYDPETMITMMELKLCFNICSKNIFYDYYFYEFVSDGIGRVSLIVHYFDGSVSKFTSILSLRNDQREAVFFICELERYSPFYTLRKVLQEYRNKDNTFNWDQAKELLRKSKYVSHPGLSNHMKNKSYLKLNGNIIYLRCLETDNSISETPWMPKLSSFDKTDWYEVLVK